MGANRADLSHVEPESDVLALLAVARACHDLGLPDGALSRALRAYADAIEERRALGLEGDEEGELAPAKILTEDARGLTVTVGAAAFRCSDGAWVWLMQRPTLARVLEALVTARMSNQSALGTHELFEAGWPGENARPEAAAARVHTAIKSLRRLGLEEIIVRNSDGYFLDPCVPLVRANRASSPPRPATLIHRAHGSGIRPAALVAR